MKKVLAILLALAMVFCFAACAKKEEAKKEEPVAPSKKTASLQIGQIIGAAHGTKCFTVATAVIEGDKVVKAYIDEYQYLNGDGVVPVPNADNAEGFGAYMITDNKLASKRDSDVYYTNALKTKAQATMDYVDNLKAVEKYCEGKTIAELSKGADAVSGCTLTDASGYVKIVAEAATAAKKNAAVTYEYEGDLTGLTLKMVNAGAHGTKCFTIATALTDGKTIVLSYIDEFQYMTEGAEGVVAVPNSDNFKDYVKEGSVLGSKRYSNVYYSNNLKNKAQATMEYVANLDAIQNFINGKTIAELEKGVDSVSGSTLTDAPNYVKAVVQAAK